MLINSKKKINSKNLTQNCDELCKGLLAEENGHLKQIKTLIKCHICC